MRGTLTWRVISILRKGRLDKLGVGGNESDTFTYSSVRAQLWVVVREFGVLTPV